MTESFGKVCSFLQVDDNADELYFVREVAGLTGLPFHIESFCSADEAVAYIAGRGPLQDRRLCPFPEFVLLDYDLKVTIAPRVITAVRKLPRAKALPIVIYSNGGDQADALRCYQAGADHYLVKPTYLSRVRIILETLYRCATAEPPDYEPLCCLEEHRLHIGEAQSSTTSPGPRLKQS